MSASETKRINGSTRDFVYETIKEKIINWDLEPGTKISEKEIASQLQVSRTPVREAFLKLAQEELLGVFPQSGTIVSQIDLALVEEGRFVRQKIERAIVEEFCANSTQEQLFLLESNLAMQELCLEKGSHHRLFELDEEFHRIMFESCKKVRTWKMIRQMNSHFDRLRVLRLASNTHWDGVVSQHKKIFEYLELKDVDAAAKEISDHLDLVNYEKDELKLRYPGYFK
ncbi:GntR family transcriptional regulator [Aquibacillus sp. 3ASR75-54]|uniref:GntR family transcriptional regulator n=1 Tax=Aquibacillus salsiterrae TaxID=2950439 RepID=A0A9X3WGA5_9BACI|nr:GntR family transcriptional regulator [Aquibacillus salsiterrae]MDC3416909.1 GntR family transcriptional regulator [Aquibacillus salsiterrae]